MSLSSGAKRIILLFFLLFFCLNFSAYAVKMNIDPPRVEIAVSPGGSGSGYIAVVNYDTDETIHVKAYINDLVYLPDGSNDFIETGATPWSVADWLKIGPTEFTIAAGGQMQMRYIADVPEDAAGGRYGVVFFEVSPPLQRLKSTSGTAINIRVGSIFLVTASGTEKYEAQLQDLVVGSPDESGVFAITCNIKNTGNVLVRPNGPVKIMDAQGATVAQLQLNPEKSGVLPGTNREFSVQYEQGKLDAGEYSLQAVLDYGGEILLGGETTFKITH